MEIDAGNQCCLSRDSLSHWIEKHIIFFAAFHAFAVCAKGLGQVKRGIEALIVNRTMSSTQKQKGPVRETSLSCVYPVRRYNWCQKRSQKNELAYVVWKYIQDDHFKKREIPRISRRQPIVLSVCARTFVQELFEKRRGGYSSIHVEKSGSMLFGDGCWTCNERS